MKKLASLFLLLVLLATSSCTSDHDFATGKRQLESQGYTDVTNTGWEAFCCDEKDGFSTGFAAKDKSGNAVSGCLCSGFMKGVTIRFE